MAEETARLKAQARAVFTHDTATAPNVDDDGSDGSGENEGGRHGDTETVVCDTNPDVVKAVEVATCVRHFTGIERRARIRIGDGIFK